MQSEHSLFQLSKYLLFRDSAPFYILWAEIVYLYSPQFWISFWSEQLFRAYYFILYQKQNDFRLSKQIGLRLPFEFIKSGWRYLDINLLKEAHHLLYQIDYNLKNGGSDLGLDLFINKFLIGSFA